MSHANYKPNCCCIITCLVSFITVSCRQVTKHTYITDDPNSTLKSLCLQLVVFVSDACNDLAYLSVFGNKSLDN